MRLDVMRYFLAVADEKSISKVSRKYNIPQQSLSSMMQSLVNEIGMPLFEQTKFGLTMTEAGKEVYQYCIAFMDDYIVLQKKLHPKAAEEKQKITVASQNSIAQTVLPKWFSTVYKHKTEIELNLEIANANKIINDVQEGRVQLGFILLFEKGEHVYPKLTEDIVFHPLFSSRPYFWVHENNPLFRQQSISMGSLAEYTVVRDSNADGELFEYIFEEFYKTKMKYLHTKNGHIILQLLQDNIVVCPDFKVEKGVLGWAYLFEEYSELKAVPLCAKDNYKIITGYIMKPNGEQFFDLETILKYLK